MPDATRWSPRRTSVSVDRRSSDALIGARAALRKAPNAGLRWPPEVSRPNLYDLPGSSFKVYMSVARTQLVRASARIVSPTALPWLALVTHGWSMPLPPLPAQLVHPNSVSQSGV